MSLILSLVVTACIQVEPDAKSSQLPDNVNKTNPKLIFSTNHEPINSLRYVGVRVDSPKVSSVRIFGSTNKNISNLDGNTKSIKHLVHPQDQYFKAVVTNKDGTTYSTTFRIDVSEIVL